MRLTAAAVGYKFSIVMRWSLLFQTLPLTDAMVLLAPQAKADGTVSLNNYDSGYGIWLVQSGVTNPAPAGTMV